jgi:glycosyltransferase involved in cell wall biosynthesis
MKKTKCIFVHILNDYSGSPKVLSQVIKAVQKNGYELDLYTGKSKDGFLSDLTNQHHYFFYIRFNNKYLTLISYVWSQLSLFLKLLKYRNEDVTFYINTLLPFGAALAGKLIKKPIIYHIHETSIKPQILKNFLRFIVQISASKILFVSKSLQKLETFQEENKEYIVYNALAEDFKLEANAYNYTWKHNGYFNVLMICSLKAYKGVYEFLTIAKECESTSEITFTLILNAEQSEIETFFSETELSKNITIVARQTNLFPYYQKASLVLNLSRIDEWVETFGLTIIEAMAFGIPVIVPPVGGPAEIVRNDLEGYCMSSYETSAIAKKIKELSLDQILCSKLSLNAKKRSSDFSEEVFEQQIIKVLSE